MSSVPCGMGNRAGGIKTPQPSTHHDNPRCIEGQGIGPPARCAERTTVVVSLMTLSRTPLAPCESRRSRSPSCEIRYLDKLFDELARGEAMGNMCLDLRGERAAASRRAIYVPYMA